MLPLFLEGEYKREEYVLNERERLVIFDVCGTLYNSNTSYDFLKFYLKDNKKYKVFAKIRDSFIFKVLNYVLFIILKKDLFRTLSAKFLRGSSEEEIKKQSIVFYNNFLKNRERKNVIDLLEEYKLTNDVILVSASYQFLIEIIAKNLGVNSFLSSSIEVTNGKLTGKYNKDLLGQKELYIYEKYPNVDKIFVITDNKSDISLVNKSEYAIIISKKKNRKFWEERGLNKYEIWEV